MNSGTRNLAALAAMCFLSSSFVFGQRVLTPLEEQSERAKEIEAKWREEYRREGEAHYRLRSVMNAMHAIVLIEGRLGETPTLGAGIIVGRDGDVLYVATANHVVRRGSVQAHDLKVVLHTGKNRRWQANLLPRFDSTLDLTVLAISGVSNNDFDVCSSLSLLIRPKVDSIGRGTRVYPVGHPNGELWILPAEPDAIVRVEEASITFQSVVLSVGHSGGGLLTANGSLIGMIIKDSPPFGSALPIEKIMHALQQWNIPTQLSVGYREMPLNSSSAIRFPVPKECQK